MEKSCAMCGREDGLVLAEMPPERIYSRDLTGWQILCCECAFRMAELVPVVIRDTEDED